ncbi:MAG: GIY-YIG nuclease family protein [Thaumarchaeota archaeon]|nr:GIY-YIG nuclease family protein [Nitrososphaerota archaeon]
MAEWFVYILRCRTGHLYTGVTTNLERRLKQHNSGTGSKFTRSRLPVSLVFKERLPNRSFATKRELRIKRMALSKKLKLIRG